MRTILTALACLVLTPVAFSQTPPAPFCAGGGPLATPIPFYLGSGRDSARVAIRLPEEMTGRIITTIRAHYSTPTGGAVPEEGWLANAEFAWGLIEGTDDYPGDFVGEYAFVPLRAHSEIRIGGWLDTPVEWQATVGHTWWLVGFWQKNAEFVRLTQSQRDSLVSIHTGQRDTVGWIGPLATKACTAFADPLSPLYGDMHCRLNGGVPEACTVYADANGFDSVICWKPSITWGEWTGAGLEVEVAHVDAASWIPSGVFDDAPSTEPADGNRLRASIAGSSLIITTIDAPHDYHVQVVNILGQTVVNHSGYADSGELRIPWSLGRPSGVYFCRIRTGQASYTVPVVNIK